jgi:competence protein ComEC
LDRKIEYVLATHPHDDHIKGLLPVMERYQIGQLIVPAALAKEPANQPLYDTAARNDIPVVQAKTGDRIDLGGATLTVLWPPADCLRQLQNHDFNVSEHDPVNICSLVTRLDYCDQNGCRRALLMADATSESEAIMAEQNLVTQADILKIGHHGSRFASTAAFIRAVKPKEAIIQVGKNTFGHPNLGVLLRLKAVGAKIWRTDEKGDIRALPGKKGFTIKTR